jgi:hypothetical protein
MSTPLTTALIGIAAVHIGFLYIFSAVYEWSWFYQGGSWSPYYVIGRENTLALFKAFGGVCYACGFLFVTLTLVQNEMWFALAGLVLHSAAVLWLGLNPAITATRRRVR